MEEFFPFKELCEIGFFNKSMESDYEAQAARVCEFFGYESVYEYGKAEMRIHLSYAPGERPLHINPEGKLEKEPFVTVIPGIYD